MASSSPEEAVKAAGIGLGLVGHWGPGWEEGARSPSPGLREGEGRRGRSRPPLSLSPPQSASHPRVGGPSRSPHWTGPGPCWRSLGTPQLSLGVTGQALVASQPPGCPRLRAWHSVAGTALESREARTQQSSRAPHRRGRGPHWGPRQGSAIRSRDQAPPRLKEGGHQRLPRPPVAPRLCHSGPPAGPFCSVPDCPAAQPRPPRPGYRKGRESGEPGRLPGILGVQVNGQNRHPELRVTWAPDLTLLCSLA